MLRSPIGGKTLTAQVATTGATGASSAFTFPTMDFEALVFALTASSVSATATLNVWVQGTFDGGLTWYDMLKFPTISASSANPYFGLATAVGNNSMIGNVGASTVTSTAGGVGIPLMSPTVRTYWSLGGTTPSASFTLQAYQHQFDRGGI